MRYRRGLVPLRRKRPPPPWGDAYHAAAAVVWGLRAHEEHLARFSCGAECERWWIDVQDAARVAARAKLTALGLPGLDVDTVADECAKAAVEVCRSIGPEWRVAWLDGAPIVEREIVVEVGPITSWNHFHDQPEVDAEVDLVVVIDLCLQHVETGRYRVVDHKSTGSWPEETGEALTQGEDLVGLDLRDDLQVRLYVAALRRMGLEVHEGGHMVRFAGIADEPAVLKRGSLSRAQSLRSSPDAWRRAIRRAGLREEDYQAEIARSSLVRWHAYAPAEFTDASVESAVRQVIEEAEDILRRGDEPTDHPRRHVPGRWQPHRQGRWTGLYPATGAESFAYSCCAACDYRDLCVAEEQGRTEDAELVKLGQFEYRPIPENHTIPVGSDDDLASENEAEEVD